MNTSTKESFFPPLNTVRRTFNLPTIEPGREIPRTIHQTYMSKNLPPELHANAENIKRLNPGWSHIVHDDADIKAFIAQVYGSEILGYYDRIDQRYGAARADLFRYLLMYKYGGVYMDVKSTCTQPLDDVLKADDRFVLAQWRNKPGEKHAGWGTKGLAHVPGGEYQQWHIVAAPGHPFMRAVIETVLSNIDQYRPWAHGTGAHGVLRLTGPIAYTLAIQPLLATSEYRLVPNETALGFEYSIFQQAAHQGVFKTHYSTRTESIVKLRGANKLAGDLLNFARKSKRQLFGISSGKPAR
jgi:hypothetical protein